MIFLTSYIWDLDIYHPCGDDVREPTLHLCGEYQASIMGNTRTFMYPRVGDIFFMLQYIRQPVGRSLHS